MKKFILTLIAACTIAFSANAQFYLSGSIGFDLSSADGVSTSSWHIDPGFGFKFTQHSAIGLYMSLGGAGSSFEWSANPYYRYTFGNARNFHFFTEAAFKIGQSSQTLIWGIGLVPGLSYTISKKVNVIARIGYLGVNGVQKHTAFRLNVLQSSTIGFEFSF